jgi:antitoxin (DNA-binding transcriptional repressor) of toxin-antitoxin stability system
MTVSEARAAFSDVLDRVMTGEEVTLTRHGKPVAVVVRPDALRVRRAGGAWDLAENVRTLLEGGRRSRLVGRGALTTQRADELIADVHAGRSER